MVPKASFSANGLLEPLSWFELIESQRNKKSVALPDVKEGDRGVYRFINEEARQLQYVHKEFLGIKYELDSIQAFLKDADRRATDEGDTTSTKEGIKAWVKQLREASFRIEDVIDEYIIYVAQGNHQLGFIASLQKISGVIKTLVPRLRLASEIQELKLLVRGINERGRMYNFQPSLEHGSSSITRRNRNSSWLDPRLDSLFIEESDVVGFEYPREQLVGLLLNGTMSRTVISVVGMRGLGKTTLAKSVFDNQELQDISYEIVQKCEGLPLAIVAVAGLLSTKDKTIFEWKKIFKYLSFELECNPHLVKLTRILALSYDDLPHYLKSCILYFGIYLEDYSVRSSRLIIIRQWIAESFIEYEEGKAAEDVAEEYLTELIHRSLVQVSKVKYHGKVKSCTIHDMVREMIIRKMKDMSFCHIVHEVSPPVIDVITRRLALTTSSSDVQRSIEHSRTRSLYIFEASKLPEYDVSQLYAKSKLSKVLDLEGASVDYVPNHLGNLFHLRFLSLRNKKVKSIPKSIGKLQNLETLDLKETPVSDLPSEINKLTKLRYLLVCFKTASLSMVGETGVQMKKGVGSLTLLGKLYHVEADQGGVDLIIELSKLRQLRKLGLKKEMGCLESLHISAITEDEIIDLQLISSPPHLRHLHLFGRLEKLPELVPRLRYLVRLSLRFSKLKDDPLKKLKDLPYLSRFVIACDAYDGEMLHFEVGFLKLKRLFLIDLNNSNSIVIDDGALISLERIQMMHLPQLQEMPSDFHLLKKLETLHLSGMEYQFTQCIEPNEGHKYWVVKHVPFIYIKEMNGPYSHHYCIIRHT
ncbi:hypothetical protein RIF29_19658 [Crotalaria pallida]|uniref:Uncharacterized protein n=1 Tax=Crotalaria pallida TaxID=3830 RepID=A0AAN9IBL9_CROPI